MIDHICVSENIFNAINEYTVLRDSHNLSDHSAVILSLHIDVDYVTMQNEVIDDDLNNCDYLDNQLAGVSLPIEALRCTARSCNIHNASLQNYHDQIINACIVPGIETLPGKGVSRDNSNKPMAGWSEHVDEHKQRASFWHWLRRENGSPRHGPLADTCQVSLCCEYDKEITRLYRVQQNSP